ncbi:MAG: DoxX family membrane protein [Verrucomicrobiota bacterium]|nr:DoxX family membrane protein [Verrucomicrobiota bacterium]
MPSTIDAKLISIGRLFFGIALVAWGIQHLVAGNFVTRVVPWWPAWIPARSLCADLIGGGLIVAGVAIVFNLKPRIAALAFCVFALSSFVLLGLPLTLKDRWLGASWTVAGKALVMSGGAMLIAVSLGATGAKGPGILLRSTKARDGFSYFGRACLGLFMILGGMQHFIFPKFVAMLIPSSIPGTMFWVYFAGVALIAGGLGMMTPIIPRMAALFSGAMIFAWVFLIHLPLVVKRPHDPGQWAAVFEALAFSGIAFLIAGMLGERQRRPG